MNNMWKNLRKTLRETMWNFRVEYSTFLTNIAISVVNMCIMFGFHKIIREFYYTFSTESLFGLYLLQATFYTVSTYLITTIIKYLINTNYNNI